MTVRDTDRGWQAFLRGLQNVEQAPLVVVGLPAGSTDDEVIAAAAANEYGTDTIPARPVFRSTADERQGQIADLLQVAVVDAVDGRVSIETGLGRAGEATAGWIKEQIRALRDPPNADSTIAAKGSSNPLIDTGRTRAAVTHELRRRGD